MIYFNVKEVADHLVKKGYVYTLRHSNFNESEIAKLYNGKVVYVKLSLVDNVTASNQLTNYVADSGFKDVSSWYNLAMKLHKQKQTLYLYKAEIEK